MTRSSVATSLWDHPVRRPAMGDLQYWWSLVRSHLDLMMSQCCSNYNCPWTRKSFAASCHQAPFVNLAALLCSSLEKKMLSKKYGNVQQLDQSFHQSVDFVLHARTYSLIPQNMQVGLIEDSKLSNRSLSHSNRWIIRFAHIMSKLQNSQDSSWQWTDKTIKKNKKSQRNINSWPMSYSDTSPYVPGSDLQVCRSKSLTCCTKKMEERYQVAARRDIENLLQTSSSSLKFLISRNLAAFQGKTRLLGQHSLPRC